MLQQGYRKGGFGRLFLCQEPVWAPAFAGLRITRNLPETFTWTRIRKPAPAVRTRIAARALKTLKFSKMGQGCRVPASGLPIQYTAYSSDIF
jgi:hypothetical protein